MIEEAEKYSIIALSNPKKYHIMELYNYDFTESHRYVCNNIASKPDLINCIY